MTGVLTRVANLYAFAGPDAMGTEIIRRETERGFKVIRPGEVEWLDWKVWSSRTIVSLDKHRVRLVALEAHRKSVGSFSQLIEEILDHELVPVVVEPHDRLARTLTKWGWKHRRIGKGLEAENLWYPRQ